MNFFYEDENFYGKVDLTQLRRQSNQLLELVQNIRERLGKQGYLLDRYLSMVLEGLDASTVFNIVGRFDALSRELSAMISGILHDKDTYQEHIFYPKVKDYIRTHPLPYQELYTQHSLYMTALIDEFLEFAVTQFTENLMKQQRTAIDIIDIGDSFQQICSILGDETQMEQLNLLVQQRFQVVTPMSAFVQFFNERLLSSLIYRDAETCKQIFQLL